jgi:Tfp pilus assembly protein PilE
MARKRLTSESGITLMEVTVAVALFAVVMGVSAQALASFYGAIDQQELRIEAIQASRSVLGEIRQKREQFYDISEDSMAWDDFHDWIDEQNDDGWERFQRSSSGDNPLREHEIQVTLRNLDGGAAVPGDNPIEVQATSTWLDLRGRPMRATLVTIMADR